MSETKPSPWLLLIPFGIAAFLVLTYKPNPDNPSNTAKKAKSGKEAYYLAFNKDEIFKNLIAIEGHFRNVHETGVDVKGFLTCNVKHLADAEGHSDEAISHSQAVSGKETSEDFRKLRNEIRSFRHDIQADVISPTEGIERVREIRRQFESFNPEFDISKCEACTIQVSVTKEGTPVETRVPA